MSVNAVEIRAIVERMVRQGRILKPAPTPTERRAKLNVPSEKRTLVNTALNVIRCDQCGTRFKKKCSVHLRCSRECSRKANGRGGAAVSVNAVEIRAIVERMVRQGRIKKPDVPKEKRRLANTALNIITCDQCGKRFQKKCSVHLRCSRECSRKANLESVRVWHVARGLRGAEHGPHDCDQCGTKFKKKTRGHRFCNAECRALGIGKLRSNNNATR